MVQLFLPVQLVTRRQTVSQFSRITPDQKNQIWTNLTGSFQQASSMTAAILLAV